MFDSVQRQPAVHGRPRSGTLTGRVWDIADEVTREKGRRAERREVIERYAAESGNRNTAGTQFQYWKKHYESRRNDTGPDSTRKRRDVEPRSLRVAPDGRVLIPLEMREAIELGDDGRVTARVEAGELRIVSQGLAVRQIQSCMRKYKMPGESVVNRFLADRRALWGEE